MLALTGASGWIGNNAIQASKELDENGHIYKDMILYTSKNKEIKLPFICKSLDTYDLCSLKKSTNITRIIHTAFIRSVLKGKYSLEQYISLNRQITDEIVYTLKKYPKIPIISISSGVARDCDKNDDISINPYAFLKNEEEKRLQDLSSDRMVLVFRVYACTGPFLRLPTHYALGQFLQNALDNKEIQINSTKRILRSYVFLPDLMSLSLKILDSPLANGYYLIDAVTHKLELGELASFICNNINNVGIKRPNISKETSSYCADSMEFIQLAKRYNQNITSIDEQIKITAEKIIYSKSN